MLRGVAYSVKAYQIPLGSRIAKGVPLPQVLPISSEEQVMPHVSSDNSDLMSMFTILLAPSIKTSCWTSSVGCHPLNRFSPCLCLR